MITQEIVNVKLPFQTMIYSVNSQLSINKFVLGIHKPYNVW